MKKLSSEVQDVDRCVKCGHPKPLDFNGVCESIPSPIQWTKDKVPNPVVCGCKCAFPSVSEVEDKNSGEGGKVHRAFPRTESKAASKLKAEPTPRPWQRVVNGSSAFGDDRFIVWGPRGEGFGAVCRTWRQGLAPTQEEAETAGANAELIVHCVNLFPTMIAALQKIYDCGSISEAERVAASALALANIQVTNTSVSGGTA